MACKWRQLQNIDTKYLRRSNKTQAVTCSNKSTVFTVRSSYASAVLGIVILSVCLSVCHRHAWWRNYRTYCRYFDITWKGSHSSFLTLTEVAGSFHLKFELKLTHPSKKRRLQPISAYNVWTVTASKKRSIIANRKSTTRFPTSYRWSPY